MRALRPVLACIPLFLLAAAPALSAPALMPHRAVYDLVLEDSSDRSGITGLTGRMVYEFDGSACEGYTTTFRFVTRIETDEMSRLSDIQTSSYEDGEGKNFSFVSKSFVDEKPEKEVKGRARIDDEGTEVTLERPESRTLRLDRTMFPTQHMLDLIGRAKAQETFYETTIFDASEDADRLMTTTVVVGKKAPVASGDPERAAMGDLAGEQFWPVDMAYFDLSSGDEIPSYRISFKLHEGGLTRDLVMDYGDFSMKGTLVELTKLPPAEACGR